MLPPSTPRTGRRAAVSAEALALKLQDLARGISTTEFDETPEGHRLAKLAADRLLLDLVMLEKYAGPAWGRLSTALAAYAFQVAKAWLATGKIFGICVAKGFGAQPPLPRNLDGDDVGELAGLLVAESLIRFRDKVLRRGLWDPLQGASLSTYFMGMCVRVFPLVYRPWRTAVIRAMRMSGTNTIPERSDPRPDALAILSAEVRLKELASPPDRPILTLLAADYTSVEIGEELGLTTRAVESRIFRMRAPWRRTTTT